MNEKVLGKITSINYGLIDKSRLGILFTFKINGDFVCGEFTAPIIEMNERTEWTEEDRKNEMVEIQFQINEWLKQAKVNFIEELRNVPVEVELDRNMFKSFRILTEVL